MVEQAREGFGRSVFAGVPSDAPEVISMFREAGFVEEGRWLDFFEVGVDDAQFRLKL